MIYILIGEDRKSKNTFIKELTLGRESFFVFNNNLDKNLIMNHANSISLFNDNPIIIIENIINEGIITFTTKELELLKKSETIFIFKEDKMLVANQKKYEKYGELKIFEDKKSTINKKFNTFSIADAYEKKDKILAWTLYRKAIEEGVEPEAISGVIFWKIKNMILNKTQKFTKEELRNQLGRIVYIYHKAHKGELDFTIGLEKFILESLSYK